VPALLTVPDIMPVAMVTAISAATAPDAALPMANKAVNTTWAEHFKGDIAKDLIGAAEFIRGIDGPDLHPACEFDAKCRLAPNRARHSRRAQGCSAGAVVPQD
jgi:hypothetical protein